MTTPTFNILISDKFRKIISNFESESLIARLLLSQESGELVSDPINYISVSEQDLGKVSYLSIDRAEKVIKNYNIEKGYTAEIIDKLLWTSSIRFHARPGSFISKIFKNISNREIETFSNLYKANVNKPKFEFSIVSGNEIKKYYHYESYATDNGSLGNSCMRHNDCQKYLGVYLNNKESSMLIMLDDGMLLGRALLWNYDSHRIMDRIYTNNDETLPFYFKKWATDNGYLYKSEQNWFNTLFFESLGNKKQEIRLDLKLELWNHQYYPYVDTFKWINMETGMMHNYIPSDNKNIKTLVASDGSKFNWDYVILDEIDKVYRYKNECALVGYLGLWTTQNNLSYSDINNKWILRKDSKYDEELGDYVFGEELDHMNDAFLIEERLVFLRKKREEREKSKAQDKLIRQNYSDGGPISIRRRDRDRDRTPQSIIDDLILDFDLPDFLSVPRSHRNMHPQELPPDQLDRNISSEEVNLSVEGV